MKILLRLVLVLVLFLREFPRSPIATRRVRVPDSRFLPLFPLLLLLLLLFHPFFF